MLCGLDVRAALQTDWVENWQLLAAESGLELTWCRAAKVHDYPVCSGPCLSSWRSVRAARRRRDFGQASTGGAKCSDALKIMKRKSNHMLAKKIQFNCETIRQIKRLKNPSRTNTQNGGDSE